MVTAYGFNRNMGYTVLTDKDYRYVVARCSQYHENYIYFIQHPNENIRKKLWFYLMGLIETWDIVNDR